MSDFKVVRYSEAFKRQVVRELEDGTLASMEAARRRYDIRGTGTIRKWLARFGRNDLMAKVVRVQRPEERDQVKLMEKKIRELEHALAVTRMREILMEGYFGALCEEVGVDPEAQKKKLDGKPSTMHESRGGGKGGSR